MIAIYKLPFGTYYRRKNGDVYMKLPDYEHVRVKFSGNLIILQGVSEGYNPNEEVEEVGTVKETFRDVDNP